MPIPQGKLSLLQDGVAAILAATAEIADSGLKIITSRNGSIQSQIDEALAGLIPSIVVYPPSGAVSLTNPTAVIIDGLKLTIRVLVDPQSFQATAADVGELVIRRLHQQRITVDPAKAEHLQPALLAQPGGDCLLPIDSDLADEFAILLFCPSLGLAKYTTT